MQNETVVQVQAIAVDAIRTVSAGTGTKEGRCMIH